MEINQKKERGGNLEMKTRTNKKKQKQNNNNKKRTQFGRLNLTQTRPAQSGSKIRSSYCAFII